MNPELVAALLGLTGGMAWGTGDFFGGLASRRISPYSVVFFGQLIGMVLLFVAMLLLGEPIPPAGDLALGAVGGLFGAIGLLFFYRALSVSKMSAAAPVTAVLTALIPIVVGIAIEGAPAIVQLAGMGLALVAIFLISREEGGSIVLSELRLPMIAGFGFGMYLMLIARASDTSALWPILSGRVASITMILIVGLRLNQIRRPNMTELRVIAASGIFDMLGNTLYALSAQTGRDDIAAVLASLYPAATVAWAWFLLKERLHRGQAVGVAVALLAILLIAL